MYKTIKIKGYVAITSKDQDWKRSSPIESATSWSGFFFKGVKMKTVFKKSFETFLRVSKLDRKNLFEGRGWKGKLVQTVFLSYSGSRFNQGKSDLTVCVKRIQTDMKELGVKVDIKTIRREIDKLKKKEFSVKTQGFCFRNKQGKAYKGEFTVLQLTKAGIEKINKISNGFFAGLKKEVKKVALQIKISVEGGYTYLSGKAAQGWLDLHKLTEQEYLERYI